MASWFSKHSLGISAGISGLCFQATLERLGDGNYEIALLELILGIANLWMYNVTFKDRYEGL